MSRGRKRGNEFPRFFFDSLRGALLDSWKQWLPPQCPKRGHAGGEMGWDNRLERCVGAALYGENANCRIFPAAQCRRYSDHVSDRGDRRGRQVYTQGQLFDGPLHQSQRQWSAGAAFHVFPCAVVSQYGCVHSPLRQRRLGSDPDSAGADACGLLAAAGVAKAAHSQPPGTAAGGCAYCADAG